jgi:DNA polymerase III gamma/tau subunit
MAMITTGRDLRMRLHIYETYLVNTEVGTEELYDLLPGTLNHEQYELLDTINQHAKAGREAVQALIASIPSQDKVLLYGNE